jgi:hypothetical protein
MREKAGVGHTQGCAVFVLPGVLTTFIILPIIEIPVKAFIPDLQGIIATYPTLLILIHFVFFCSI